MQRFPPPGFTVTPAHYAPAPQSGRALLWLLLGVLGMFAFMTLVVLLAGWIGFKIFTEQALEAIRADPVVTAAVGEVHEISLDFTATFQAPDPDEFAYRIDGERSDGLLVGRFITIDADHEELRDGTLTLDDGQVLAIGTVQQRLVDPSQAEADD